MSLLKFGEYHLKYSSFILINLNNYSGIIGALQVSNAITQTKITLQKTKSTKKIQSPNFRSNQDHRKP